MSNVFPLRRGWPLLEVEFNRRQMKGAPCEDLVSEMRLALAESYVEATIDQYVSDPPQSAFHKGYLVALMTIYRRGFGHEDNARLAAAERVLMQELGLP